MIRDLFNVPNIISLVRLALIPLFIYLVASAHYGWAGLLFGFIGATDWIDGYLARRLDQVTEVGKFLDPLADRLAVAIAVIGGLITGVLPEWFAWAIIVREVLIGAGAIYGWSQGVTKLDVRWIGKLATFGLYFSVAIFFVAAGLDSDPWRIAGTLIGVPSLILYYIVAVMYAADMRDAVQGVRSEIEG